MKRESPSHRGEGAGKVPRRERHPAERSEQEKALVSAVRQLFRKHFGIVPAHVVHAPGTLELLGSHAEVNHGLVLLSAFDQGVGMAVSPRTDGRVELVMAGQVRPEVFWADRLRTGSGQRWADPVKAVLAGLKRKRIHCGGFNGALLSLVPSGLGAGEVEALMLAVVLAVRQLAPFRITELGLGEPPLRDARGRLPGLLDFERRLLAELCAGVAVEAGLGLQWSRFAAALLSKAWHVSCLDCKMRTQERASLVGEVLVLCDSGVRVADGGGMESLRTEWEGARVALKAKSLRSVELSYLKSNRGRLSDRQYACAYHAVGEVQRVVHTERALREDDHRQVGHFMFASHESAAEHLGNSVPEVELLMELARRQPGCLGARMMGDGFGGATINLVTFHQVVSFTARMSEQFQERTSRELRSLVCQMVDGA